MTAMWFEKKDKLAEIVFSSFSVTGACVLISKHAQQECSESTKFSGHGSLFNFVGYFVWRIDELLSQCKQHAYLDYEDGLALS